MKDMRVGVILLLLALRLMVNFGLVSRCKPNDLVRIAGIVEKVYRNKTKSILLIGNFRVVWEGKERILVGEQVSLVGKCSRGVIEILRGEISLIEPRIEERSMEVMKKAWLVRQVESFREKLLIATAKQLPEPENGLLAGILLGYKGSLGKGFTNALIESGTIHVAVASGYNVSVVGLAVLYLSNFFLRRREATVLVILAIVFYVLLAGGEPPVVRAAIMGSVMLLTKVKGRQIEGGELLLMACLIMLQVRPSLLEEVSFQLSVTATLGMIYVSPFLEKMLDRFKNSLVSFVLQTELVPTVSATLMTAPLIAWHFGRINLMGIISNLFVLPLITPVMVLGTLQILLNLVWEPLGNLVAPISFSLLHLMVVLIGWFGKG